MSYYQFKSRPKIRNSNEFNAWIDSSVRRKVIKGFQDHLIRI